MDTIWHKNGSAVLPDSTGNVTPGRLSRRRVRGLTVITDMLLVNVGFVLAYLARYRWQWLREVEVQFSHPYFEYLPQQILFNIFNTPRTNT